MRKNKFSKLLSMFLALTMTLSLASCGSAQSSTEQKENSGAVIEQETEEQPAEEEPSEEETEEAQEPALEKVDINLAALKGPTALGMLDLLEKNDNGEAANNYNVTLAGAPDEIVGKIVSGDLDIAAVPTNVASTCTIKHRRRKTGSTQHHGCSVHPGKRRQHPVGSGPCRQDYLRNRTRFHTGVCAQSGTGKEWIDSRRGCHHRL